MKKNYKNLLLLLLIGIILIPTIVLGEGRSIVSAGKRDPVPEKTKQAYFLVYPNGYTVGYEELEDPENPPEILLYQGKSNDNGEIILEDINSEGQLRIIETVPTGYTIDNKEITVDLANSTTTGFINYKGLINPATGRKALYIVIAVLLIVLAFITYKQRVNGLVAIEKNKNETNTKEKKTKKKKVVSILIFLSAILVSIMYNTKVINKNFIITTKDSHGNKMPNVEVTVYAKPISITKANYIKFSANGGEFLDGSTEMIYELPLDACTLRDFYNSLSEEESFILDRNRNGATREGYYIYREDNIKLEEAELATRDLAKNITDTYNREVVTNDLTKSESSTPIKCLNSGDVIETEWTEDSEARVYTVHGNGGTAKIGYKEVSSVKTYNARELADFNENIYGFTNVSKTFVGYDNNASCSHYQYGYRVDKINFNNDFYACWEEKPDGIYIGNYIYKGNMDNCYSPANAGIKTDNIITFFGNNYNESKNIAIRRGEIGLKLNTSEYFFTPYIYYWSGMRVSKREISTSSYGSHIILDDSNTSEVQKMERVPVADGRTTYYDFDSIEIINHGETLIKLTLDDLNKVTDSETGEVKYYVKSTENINTLRNYFGSFSNKCVKEEIDSGLVK